MNLLLQSTTCKFLVPYCLQTLWGIKGETEYSYLDKHGDIPGQFKQLVLCSLMNMFDYFCCIPKIDHHQVCEKAQVI